MKNYLSGIFNGIVRKNRRNSIKIVNEADGPTAVCIANDDNLSLFLLKILLLFGTIGLFGIVYLNKRKNKH